MNIKNKINFIKKHIKKTHNEVDLKDLLSFNEQEINQIYKQIIGFIRLYHPFNCNSRIIHRNIIFRNIFTMNQKLQIWILHIHPPKHWLYSFNFHLVGKRGKTKN